MNISSLRMAFAAVFLAYGALAEVPIVATDIAPVHSLVSQVMNGVGTPKLILSPGASAHSYSLRPSEAMALSKADLVFWIGPELTPWLSAPIISLASNARVIPLLNTPGGTVLGFRENAVFEEEHDHENEEHHDHDGIDPHAWLDPENGKLWLDLIALELSALDPENAKTYAQNAAKGKTAIEKAVSKIDAILASKPKSKLIVLHDAYQYFEHRFDIPSIGAVSPNDDKAPGPARLIEIQNLVEEFGVTCALSETRINPGLIETLFAQNPVKVMIVGPLAAEFQPGPALYPEFLLNIAQQLDECL